ncbi:MAG TPA: DUF4258 domain-containing protein [Patescibacteria group bacterium]|nr:DUF4258 domain-containing protein [Patescibacteria group bacterium]
MKVRFHPHAVERMQERGTTEKEVKRAVENGERFAAKHGRTGFRRNFPYGGMWHDKTYSTKQVEAYAIEEDGWLVLTVIVKFF